MPDLTTRLLAEIERREGYWRADDAVPAMRFAVVETSGQDPLAYLGALRKMITIHLRALNFHPPATPDCPSNPRCACDHCLAIRAVAEALGVTP